MQTVKLIGGPGHGKRLVLSNWDEVYRLPVMEDMTTAAPIKDEGMSNELVQITQILYRRRMILGTEVWAPVTLRDAQIIEILVNHFNRD